MTEFLPGIITIEDSSKINVKYFIKYVISRTRKPFSFYIMCLERSPAKWIHIFPENSKHYFYESADIIKAFSSICDENSVFILDSVNQLSAIVGWSETIRIIDNIINNKLLRNLILILHNDCLLYGSKMIKHLKHISNTHIVLKSTQHGLYGFHELVKLTGGKIKQSANEVFYDGNENKWVKKKVSKDKESAVKERINLPEEVTSFKISVEDSAKAVKDGMVLPYTELHTRDSKVIYHHDAADDWDDEDPDEDLDI